MVAGTYQVTAGLVSLLWSAVCVLQANAFKYAVGGFTNQSVVSFSEQYMYGSDRGPIGYREGESSIDLDLVLRVEAPIDGNVTANLLFYRDTKFEIDIPNFQICQTPFPTYPAGFQNTHFRRVTLNRSGDYFVGDLHEKYNVVEGGLTYAIVSACNTKWKNEYLNTEFDGTITFRNPYGYIPGSDYGYMPFEAVRGSFLAVLVTWFTFITYKHRATVLRIHLLTLAVLCVSVMDSFSWFGAYMEINKTGTPYCCPYPSAVVFAMAVEIFLRASVRLLLLMLCLGYGIVRLNLEKKEKVYICVLTVAFFVTGIMELTTQARLSNKFGDEAKIEALNAWALPAFLADLIFITWIYSALVSIMEKLGHNNESYKLEMYQKLARCFSVFVFSFVFVLILVIGIQSMNYNWMWQWIWLLNVSFQVLNFAVLATIAIIWRPTRSSGMLAYSMQVATSEEQADGGSIPSNPKNGIEMVEAEEIQVNVQGPDRLSFTVVEGSIDEDEATPHFKENGRRTSRVVRSHRRDDYGEELLNPSNRKSDLV